VGNKQGFRLRKKWTTHDRTQVVKNFLKSREVLVFGIKPANGHFQDFGDAAHELIVWGVFAPLILIHPGACGHGVNPGKFAKFFLRQAGTKAGLFETVSEHNGPFGVLAT
jgi:hypothetical protein